MAGNVKFFFGSLSKYQALEIKDPLGLYFVTDESTGKVYLYKGDKLYASDALASHIADGLMSSTDKALLDELIAIGGLNKLQAVDGSIAIIDSEGGKKNIGVQISKSEGNLISVNDDGLFAKIDVVPLESVIGLVDRLEAIENQSAGNGITLDDGKISVSLAVDANGLQFVDGKLGIALATNDTAGALSAVDKAFISSIPDVYMSKEMTNAVYEHVKYEITNVPQGTLVNYGEKEIRVMCPADTKWVKQNVGNTGNANMYYMGFKAYAPKDAVGFKEGDHGVIIDEYFDFNGNFAGTDEYGRNFSICWLALASRDAGSDTWTYFGKNSTEEGYIGWDYVVNWYNSDGVVIASDCVRINLSNENCHYSTKPYYVGGMMKEIKTIVEEKVAGVESAYEVIEF